MDDHDGTPQHGTTVTVNDHDGPRQEHGTTVTVEDHDKVKVKKKRIKKYIEERSHMEWLK